MKGKGENQEVETGASDGYQETTFLLHPPMYM